MATDFTDLDIELLQNVDLFEIMTDPVDYQWVSRSDVMHEAKFTLNEIDFKVNLRLKADFETGRIKNEIVLTFGPMDVHSVQWAQMISGKIGNAAVRVYGTVLEILSEFIRKHDPDRIEFHAETPKKERLYRLLVQYARHRFMRYAWQEQKTPLGLKFIMTKNPKDLTERDIRLNENSVMFTGVSITEDLDRLPPKGLI